MKALPQWFLVVVSCALLSRAAVAQEARLVADIEVGPNSSLPQHLQRFGRRVIFTASDFFLGDEPRTAGGNPPRVLNAGIIAPGNGTSLASHFMPVGEQCYFTADDGATGLELWTTNAAGTVRRVADVRPGVASSGATPIGSLRNIVFFSAFTDAFGSECWRTDGTTTGTTLLVDSEPGIVSGGVGAGLALNDHFFFGTSRFIYRSDGTAAGTRSLSPSQSFLSPGHLTRLGEQIIFRVTNSESPLWVTDGTDAGTVPILVGKISELLRVRGRFAVMGNSAFFIADTRTFGTSLWRSDGTDAGTTLVFPMLDRASVDPVATADRVYFAASSEASGLELWVSDGTTTGTHPLHDILPGPQGSQPQRLTRSAGRLFFTALDAWGNRNLWVTSGDAASTRAVTFPSGSRFSNFGSPLETPIIADVLGRLYFAGEDAARGVELWTIPPVCPADWNLDGVLDEDDLLDYIDVYFGEGGIELDINEDRSINADDLADFINTFFLGCP